MQSAQAPTHLPAVEIRLHITTLRFLHLRDKEREEKRDREQGNLFLHKFSHTREEGLAT